MSKADTQVQKYMTKDIQTIGDEQPMLMVHRLMRQEHVRHLPVLHQGKLVGMVSDRDLNLLESLSTVDPKVVTVSDAMGRGSVCRRSRDVARRGGEHDGREKARCRRGLRRASQGRGHFHHRRRVHRFRHAAALTPSVLSAMSGKVLTQIHA